MTTYDRHSDVRNRVFGKNPVSGGRISIALGSGAKVLLKKTSDRFWHKPPERNPLMRAKLK